MKKQNMQRAADAELALKAYALAFDSELLTQTDEEGKMIGKIADMVDLTEAPEDAVCSLVVDLLYYCEREQIDWTHDVMARARERFRREHADEAQDR